MSSLKEALREKALDGALITSPLNLYYFTGAFALGHLLVTEREVRFLVFRPFSRVLSESPLPAEPLRSLKKLPGILKNAGIKVLGLEYAGLTHDRFLLYRKILSEFDLQDISGAISHIRTIKSPYEAECLREAGRRLAEALFEGLPKIKPGMTELEAMGLIEYELRKRGHPGFVRSFRGNEFPTGLLISGPEGVTPGYMIAGEGGLGVPGFSSGASLKKLHSGEPILCDFSGFYAGYYVDQSRMSSLGGVSPEIRDLFEMAEILMDSAERALKPGIPAEEVFFSVLKEAERLGVEKYFMANGEEGVNFVGHGVGLCIDEEPALAPGMKTELLPGMALALEPKLHVPGIGVIGLEDTFFLKEDSLERVTSYPRKWQVFY
ncbi:M24 family metallopeptidase [Thermosulfurimonas dismutans]|uniref:M24 family metallopeptidase n=1 Tax=Thermosulfurimonas dismutans TaxID=999894 RepID=UPI000838EF26|nr:Xaa-Pro peptidase family protein [Thermosulfurimonas dismutans]